MARTLEVVAGEQPLVLVIEELHWADPATLDLLRSVAQQPERTRLVVLGAYQPVHAITYGHPIMELARRLSARSACTRLGLELLSRASEQGAELCQLRAASSLLGLCRSQRDQVDA
jgi:predicted ATPase